MERSQFRVISFLLVAIMLISLINLFVDLIPYFVAGKILGSIFGSKSEIGPMYVQMTQLMGTWEASQAKRETTPEPLIIISP